MDRFKLLYVDPRKWSIKIAILTLLLLLLLIPIAIWGLGYSHGSRSSGWERLSRIDPTLRILDDPKRLLELTISFERTGSGSNGDETVVTRWEALTRLLELQPATETIMDLPERSRGLAIDHRTVRLESAVDGVVLIVATLCERPDRPGRRPWLWEERRDSDYEDYWTQDLLAFDRAGHLLYCTPYKPEKEQR